MKKKIIGLVIFFVMAFFFVFSFPIWYQFLPSGKFTDSTKARNAGVQANCINIQQLLEQYAEDHHGKYPETLSVLFIHDNYNHQPYLKEFPRTPWDTRQAMSSNILADPNDTPWMKYGIGKSRDPVSKTDFGAICYRRSGKNHERYDLTGTGWRAAGDPYSTEDIAVCVFHVKNY